jgi:hypothetical protein
LLGAGEAYLSHFFDLLLLLLPLLLLRDGEGGRRSEDKGTDRYAKTAGWQQGEGRMGGRWGGRETSERSGQLSLFDAITCCCCCCMGGRIKKKENKKKKKN